MSFASVVVGAIAVFLVVLVSLVVQGRRQARARQAQRSDLGLQRVAVPDPVLTASILSACSGDRIDGEPSLAVLERVTIDQPGTWYVAMVRHAAAPGAVAAPMRVLLVVDGLTRLAGASAGDGSSRAIGGTNGGWTRRWASGLLVVEAAEGAGDEARDFEAMKAAGVRAVGESGAAAASGVEAAQ